MITFVIFACPTCRRLAVEEATEPSERICACGDGFMIGVAVNADALGAEILRRHAV